MHPLYGALPAPFVPVRVTCSAFVAHWYTHALPRCRTSQYCRTFISNLLSLWHDLADSVFDGVGHVIFRAVPMLFYWPKLLAPILFSLFYLLYSMGGFVGLGSSD